MPRPLGECELVVGPEPVHRREMTPDGDEQPVVMPRRRQEAERCIDESEDVNRRKNAAIGNEKELREARFGRHGLFLSRAEAPLQAGGKA
jgi:hypothetical protein